MNNYYHILSDEKMADQLNRRRKISPERILEGEDSNWYAIIVNMY